MDWKKISATEIQGTKTKTLKKVDLEAQKAKLLSDLGEAISKLQEEAAVEVEKVDVKLRLFE